MATSQTARRASTPTNDAVITTIEPTQGVQVVGKDIELLTRLINSKQLPGHVKTIEDAYTIGKMGRELGFPIMQAFHFIIPIQGKLTLSAKAIGALLRRHNVTMKTLEDGKYVYRDGTTTDYPKPGEEKPVDRRTSILFQRIHANGVVESEETSFTWIDATNAGLTTKDNWKRMPREMLYARCLSKGANRIGQDFLTGLHTTDEWFDTLDSQEQTQLNVLRNDAGEITEIITPQ